MQIKVFSGSVIDTPIYRLSGLAKLIAFIFISFAVMFSYDIRFVLLVIIFSIFILRLSKIKYSQIRGMLIYCCIFLMFNFIFTFIFAPNYGTEIYGTRHVIAFIPGIEHYVLSAEQLLYQLTKTLKYAAVIPFGIIFLLTTDPSELAASLNAVGVHYKIAYAFSLTLRYFPGVQREYNEINSALQARGLDLSRKAKLSARFKNALLIIVPLLFSTLERIETISNAMDLRGFGKRRKRTWYCSRHLKKQDIFAIIISLMILAISISLSVFINGSRFFNPFASMPL
ncbi:MAG: energy-coupling factor transporter transmembrane component T [Termitinemataceae bacterium]|nr:MAG: energy-coupling factor transporter transmembrane component T [Termitinemataceae bacterium]